MYVFQCMLTIAIAMYLYPRLLFLGNYERPWRFFFNNWRNLHLIYFRAAPLRPRNQFKKKVVLVNYVGKVGWLDYVRYLIS